MTETQINRLSKFHRDLSPFTVESVKVCRYKTFGQESLHVEPSCCVDVVVCMLNSVFW